jgi:hypothetical protein
MPNESKRRVWQLLPARREQAKALAKESK